MDEWTNIGGAIDMKVYTEPMEDGPINLASKSNHQLPMVDSNSNQEPTADPATTKEIQSSTVSSVILEPMDRDSLGNVIVEPMDRVVLDSTSSPANNLTSPGNMMDSTGSPGNTPTPTGCASPTMAPMMEEEEEEIRPVLQEGWTPLQQLQQQPTALQQLAAVAERKAQEEEEEEEMEVGGGSVAGTPTPGSPSSTPPPLCLRELPSSTTTLPPSPLDHRDLSTSRPLDHRDLSNSRPLDHRDCRDGSRIAPSSLLPSALYKPSVSHAQSLPPMHLHPEYDLPAPASSGHHSFTPSASPLTARHLQTAPAPTPSPDSAIHSTIYSPSQSPVQSRHGPFSGFSSPYHSSLRTTPSLSRNNSDASQYGGSQYSLSSATSPLSPSHYSPSHSPVTSSRYSHNHPGFPSPALPSSPLPRHSGHLSLPLYSHGVILSRHDEEPAGRGEAGEEGDQHSALAGQAGISRQQLINSPCPVCGDKISGFHYGIFSCESCKGFFKRTVQNKKNYVCLRGAQCPVAIATRKKCPACRFEKCLKMGMKLEAIREDRTRGGRSTYQCSYTIPPGCGNLSDSGERSSKPPDIPPLLQEIMNVEHLWFSRPDKGRPAPPYPVQSNPATNASDQEPPGAAAPPASPAPGKGEDIVQTLTMMADQRLYKLVKWCKSLPLFKNILIDDQIALLINAWCELLVLSCCYRSMSHPGVIRVSNDVTLSLNTARQHGIEKCVEKMLNFAEQLRRLKVDHYEYVSMKVIVLLTSDATGLKEVDQVRESQEKVVHALQDYTVAYYPDMPSKFGELLLRMPELQRVCQVGKEMLCLSQQPREEEGDAPGFNFLMELLRGDH